VSGLRLVTNGRYNGGPVAPSRPDANAERRVSLPLLLVRGKDISDDVLSTLLRSRRVQLFHASDLGASATAFSMRTARATLVATTREPLAEVVFTRTSGFLGPLILAIDPRFEQFAAQTNDAGVDGCVSLPIVQSELDRMLDYVESLPPPPIGHAALGLFLDAVNRTAHHGEAVVRLSQREFALLHCLIRRGSRPVTVQAIHAYVWGSLRDGTAMREIVDVNISQLRKKLARINLRGAIRTYRDFGYGLGEEPPPGESS
jgi:hypothetical protein